MSSIYLISVIPSTSVTTISLITLALESLIVDCRAPITYSVSVLFKLCRLVKKKKNFQFILIKYFLQKFFFDFSIYITKIFLFLFLFVSFFFDLYFYFHLYFHYSNLFTKVFVSYCYYLIIFICKCIYFFFYLVICDGEVALSL